MVGFNLYEPPESITDLSASKSRIKLFVGPGLKLVWKFILSPDCMAEGVANGYRRESPVSLIVLLEPKIKRT